MADRTISIAYKVEGNDGGFRKLVANAKDMENAIGGIAERIKSNMVNINQIAMGFANLGNVINDVSAICSDLSKAYAVQEEAETKLETVMRQRMASTDEAIQGIKDYCSEQQKLGVIGDEVQLAGAQQVATFLKSETALRTLIPAMNNLVAQQKGLNATSGDAVNIGNLLGKAMMGQTSALGRVGISFTEAEAAAVKYGSEEERAAALAKIITNNVGEMNTKLAQTPSGQMKQIENDLGDIKENLGGIIQGLMPAITGFNQLVMIGTSISKLVSGFTAVSASVNKLTTSIRMATGATKALRIALVSTVAGAVVVAVGFFISKIYEMATATKEATDAAAEMGQKTDVAAEAMGQAQSNIVRYKAAIESCGKSESAQAALVDELNQKFGDRMGYFSSLSDWYKALTEDSEAYCRQMVIEARTQAIAQEIADIEGAKYKQQKILRENQEAQRKNPAFAAGYSSVIAIGQMAISGYQKQIDDLYAELRQVSSEVVDIPFKGSKTPPSRPTTSSPTRTQPTTRPEPPEGSLAAMRKELQELEKEIELNVDGSRLDELLAKKFKLEQDIELKVRIQEEKENDLRINANWSKTSKDFQQKIEDTIQPTLDVKLNLDLGKVPEEFQKIPAIVNNGVKSTARLQKTMQGLSQSISSVGSAFSSIGGAIEMPELNVAGTIAQAIANIIAGFASASAQSSSMGPWAWVAFTLAGVAEIAGVIASIKNMAKFADGGIVSGPTMALVGEYAGASSNPEVIAPLNKLRELIPAGSAGTVVLDHEIVIDGSKLKIVMRNTNRRDGINGKR